MEDKQLEGLELRVGAHVLIQLGSELVTDVEQAILECVKNAYDADSPGCLIEIDTREAGVREESKPFEVLSKFVSPAENVTASLTDLHGRPLDADIEPTTPVLRRLNYKGRITIKDEGVGLTPGALSNSWLVISGSHKRVEGGPKQKTDKGRTPLGDKGLGRLGTMKLGDVLLIETATSKSDPVYSVQFRWADCDRAATVDEIPVFSSVRPNNERLKGTRVSVLGLNDMVEWRRPRRADEIAKSLARLISPFEATSTFPVGIKLDDVEHSLIAVTSDVLRRSVAEFSFKWVTGIEGVNPHLLATARLRKRLIASERKGRQAEKTKLAFGDDAGEAFADALPKFGRMRGYDSVVADHNSPWFVEIQRRYEWHHLLPNGQVAMHDPGEFEGAFYYFHLNDLDAPDDEAVAGVGVDSALIKSMSGISILRDGFRVRSSGDWLGVSSEMTSGSTYGLRVDNTIGYFALTGEQNYGLTEKSDREGFVEDAHYRGFLTIARQCRKFASEAMENVRRSLDTYVKEIEERRPPAEPAAGDPLDEIEMAASASSNIKAIADQASMELQEALQQLEQAENDGELTSDVTKQKAIQIANAAIATIEKVKGDMIPNDIQKNSIRKLRQSIEDRHEQLVSLYESAAVGLSARGLAHELRTHLTEIRQRATAIHNVAKGGIDEQRIVPLVRSIRNSCAAISSAAALIDPMLPRSRAIKDEFELNAFVAEYVSSRALAFEKAGIKAVQVSLRSTVKVRVNRPRLLQVLDNLVRNSTYWLRRSSLFGLTDDNRVVTIEVNGHGFVVWDNGPGVDPHVEDSLFEIFVTAKPDPSAGQGLGLFIVSQLLELDGATIELLPERNIIDRRYKFAVDLTSIIVSE
ncbi:hypothetical protein N185_16345 [Sinorhizobium sp. GW3]|nr:hypothetical protein N185_16345 [Sinorhizobium sp. GW3]